MSPSRCILSCAPRQYVALAWGRRANSAKRREIEERGYVIHLAHATLMEEELDRLRGEEPERYGPVAELIMPLLAIQMAEMSKKLVRSRRTHGDFEPVSCGV